MFKPSVGQGIPCSQETKFMVVFYDAYRYWKYALELQVTTSRFYTKNTGSSAAFTVTFGWCNLGLPFTFLGSIGIIQQCYACSFLGTYQSLPHWRLKHTVRGDGAAACDDKWPVAQCTNRQVTRREKILVQPACLVHTLY